MQVLLINSISFWSWINFYHLIRSLIFTIYFIDQFLYLFHYLIFALSIISKILLEWHIFSIIQMKMHLIY